MNLGLWTSLSIQRPVYVGVWQFKPLHIVFYALGIENWIELGADVRAKKFRLYQFNPSNYMLPYPPSPMKVDPMGADSLPPPLAITLQKMDSTQQTVEKRFHRFTRFLFDPLSFYLKSERPIKHDFLVINIYTYWL